MEESHRETQDKLGRIHNTLQGLVMQQHQQHQHQLSMQKKTYRLATSRDLYLVVLVLALFQVVIWLYWKK